MIKSVGTSLTTLQYSFKGVENVLQGIEDYSAT